MSEQSGHRSRLKQQILQHGLDPYPDYTALELLLFYAIPRQDTQPLARALLERFGSLQGVFSASIEQLQQVSGIGENAALLIHLIPLLHQRIRLSSARQQTRIIDSAESAGSFFLDLFAGKSEEELYMLCMDKKGKILSCRSIAQGHGSALSISVRRVVEEALFSKASAVILSHNHPSGIALPSPEDNRSTLEIFDALRSVGVELVDHIIVADEDYVSLSANGLFH